MWRCLYLAIVALGVIGFTTSLSYGEKASFDGFQVLRLVDADLSVHSKALERFLHSDKFDFWDYPRDVMTSPIHKAELVSVLNTHGINFIVWIEDVQKLIDGQHRIFPRATASQPDQFDYSVYHTYKEIDQWVRDTAARYPTLAEEFVLGTSYEDRVMRALKIGSSTNTMKKAVWIQTGIHAREWVSPATGLWMTNQLLADYSNDDEVTMLLDTYDMYILPLMNPDGYEYTWTHNRMWRKTRSINGNDTLCVGTDANRNWGFEWGGWGASPIPCSYTYRGPYAMSEIEVRNVANFIKNQTEKQDFVFFMDIHSYSQLWLNPWGYSKEDTDDYDEHMLIGKTFTEALKNVYGTTYTYGSITDLLYVASGTSVDWAYGAMSIKYSHSIELRDEGEYGFLLPPEQIIPTAEETYVGMIAALVHLTDRLN